MGELDIAREVEEMAAIGSMLRKRWQEGGFHAVVSINVPHEPFDLRGLPLSIEERDRARRFWRVMDCNRSVMSWTVLRSIVGAMLDARPENVTVVRAMAGKPSVQSGPGISISHAGDLAVVAFSSEMDIGVDVETVEQDDALLRTVMGTLSPQELAYFSTHRMAKSEFLLRAWTRKEAAVKVLGSGLSNDLTKVSVAEQKGCRFQCRLPGAEIITGTDLQMGSDYIAALASKTCINDVIQYHIERF
ncbi:4'-phosphopantetheinyl transferase family protein [Agrobacterium tumefaciens]|uniref:4'-phosphopantetheinyl transferase family protein n=1 Tax=Rhizobium/Agrobacterium group TaxID=227290 RepID=UPI001574A3D9|nr:4'-phosphopantetheinyl transferase superfamily protein [Agrobacterium tumefaciens]NTA83985.1 4'-phosphopantetheinyl transferase superfamily protein [Agrobacterium tumefaciens]